MKAKSARRPASPKRDGLDAALVFGGTGYIGSRLAASLAQGGMFSRVIVADVKPPAEPLPDKVEFLLCDVRHSVLDQLPEMRIDWIFNLAAVHREPGHQSHEYFDTNIGGARNICAYATQVGCDNQFFFSSISVYGPTPAPVDESSPTQPNTAYGMSKLSAELISTAWSKESPGRRLLIVRPGVIYGPRDPGNVLRMIRAIRKGTFILPVGIDVHKSYGYVYGLLQSVAFMLGRDDKYILYNYVERETHRLSELVAQIKLLLGVRLPTVRVPIGALVVVARLVQAATMQRSAIHPDRVRKVARPTHIVPQVLIDCGFPFAFSFASSVEHWMAISPADFLDPKDQGRTR